ncbi:hypothetical protein BJX76DRAFT_361572 [Aspergillus varians]
MSIKSASSSSKARSRSGRRPSTDQYDQLDLIPSPYSFIPDSPSTIHEIPHNMPCDWTEDPQPVPEEYLQPCNKIQHDYANIRGLNFSWAHHPVPRDISRMRPPSSDESQVYTPRPISAVHEEDTTALQASPATRTINLSATANSFVPAGNQQPSQEQPSASHPTMAASIPSQYPTQMASLIQMPPSYHPRPPPINYEPNLTLDKHRLRGGSNLWDLPVISTDINKTDVIIPKLEKCWEEIGPTCQAILRHYGQTHWKYFEICGREHYYKRQQYPTPTFLVIMKVNKSDPRQKRALLALLMQFHFEWSLFRVSVEIVDPVLVHPDELRDPTNRMPQPPLSEA